LQRVGTPASEPFRYWAFICYSREDRKWAEWLYAALQRFAIEPRFRAGLPAGAPSPEALRPVFLDRTPGAATADLDDVTRQALSESLYLIVIASPRAARCARVARAIEVFAAGRGLRNVRVLVVQGRPNAARRGYAPEEECFPQALRTKAEGSSEAEPLAADARGGRRAKESALMRLIAGLTGGDYATLRLRRQRYRDLVAAAVVTALALAAVGGWSWMQTARTDPWVGRWSGTIRSSCNYYSGPFATTIRATGRNSIRADDYIEPGDQFAATLLLTVSGEIARGAGGLTMTLKDGTIRLAYPPACQMATVRRR
jgi:hypothetical protein